MPETEKVVEVEAFKKEKHASIYFRGPRELADYDRMQVVAQSCGVSFSEHAKMTIGDPLWFLKRPKLFARSVYEYFKGDADFLGSLTKALGEIPAREQVRALSEDLNTDQLLIGIKVHKEQEQLSRIIREEFSEAYKQKMKQLHGVVINEV